MESGRDVQDPLPFHESLCNRWFSRVAVYIPTHQGGPPPVLFMKPLPTEEEEDEMIAPAICMYIVFVSLFIINIGIYMYIHIGMVVYVCVYIDIYACTFTYTQFLY